MLLMSVMQKLWLYIRQVPLYQQLSEEAQIAAGVFPNAMGVYLGLEHIDDIKADLDSALQNL